MTVRVCPACNQPVHPWYENAPYCSNACRIKFKYITDERSESIRADDRIARMIAEDKVSR